MKKKRDPQSLERVMMVCYILDLIGWDKKDFIDLSLPKCLKTVNEYIADCRYLIRTKKLDIFNKTKKGFKLKFFGSSFDIEHLEGSDRLGLPRRLNSRYHDHLMKD